MIKYEITFATEADAAAALEALHYEADEGNIKEAFEVRLVEREA